MPVILAAPDLVLFSAGIVQPPAAWEVAFLVAGFVPLLWRRHAPFLVFGLIWVHLLVAVFVTPNSLPILAIAGAIYVVAAERSRTASVIALALGYLLYAPWAVADELRDNAGADNQALIVSILLLFLLFLGGAWALGRWVQANRWRFNTLEKRRQRAATEAVESERRRIAQELHDIVSHSVSVMVLQAAGARRVLERDPVRAEQALSHIENVGKESMTELRRLLGVLRDGALIAGTNTEVLGPQPGLADLPALFESFRLGGITVVHEVQGRPSQLDGSVDLSAYRIVQESLTNVTKHAGSDTTATVRLAWAADLLIMEITNATTGRATDPSLSAGYGLIGLRERARAVGGHLEAGPVPGGGFRVTATLPVTQTTTAETAMEEQR